MFGGNCGYKFYAVSCEAGIHAARSGYFRRVLILFFFSFYERNKYDEMESSERQSLQFHRVSKHLNLVIFPVTGITANRYIIMTTCVEFNFRIHEIYPSVYKAYWRFIFR